MKKNVLSFFIVIVISLFAQHYAAAQTYKHHFRENNSQELLHATDVVNNVSSSFPNSVSAEGFFWTDLDPNHSLTSYGHMNAKMVRAYLKLYVDHDGALQQNNVPNIWA